MGKLFAVMLTVITLVSVAIFAAHIWWLPPDISARGWAVDRLMREPSSPRGFYSSQRNCRWRLFAWKYGEHSNETRIKLFPEAPCLWWRSRSSGRTEALTLTFVGSKAWASVYMAPAEPGSLAIDVQAEQFGFYFRYPGPDGKFGEIQAELMNDSIGNFFGLDRKDDPVARDDIVSDTLAIP